MASYIRGVTPAVSLPTRSTSPATECRSLSSTTYPREPEERSAKKRFIMASPADVGEVAAIRPDLSIPAQHVAVEAGEDVNYVAMPKASCQRASVLLYLGKAGYDIKLVHTDGFTRAMSQVKWSIPNPSGSTDRSPPPSGQGFAILVRHRAHFVISEGHVLRRRLGILNCQVRSHRPRPRGGHPRRFFQGETTHL